MGECGQSRVRTYVHLREQIYSLSPLTTRPSTQNIQQSDCGSLVVISLSLIAGQMEAIRPTQSRRLESNQRPTDYKSVALPTELLRLILKELLPLNFNHTDAHLFLGWQR